MPNPPPSPIRHAVVLAHPDPRSLNAAIAHNYCEAVEAAGQQALLRDLYAMNFDPVLKAQERPGRSDFRLSPDVQAEFAIMCGANVITFVYPVWFGMPPAILVGYIDRVLGAGTTVGQVQHGAGRGLLDNGHLCAITTSGAPQDWLEAQGQTQALRELAGTYLFRAFAMHSTQALHIGNVVDGAPADFIEHDLARVRQRAASICARVAEELHSIPLPPQLGDGS